jgi:hypothetical protein
VSLQTASTNQWWTDEARRQTMAKGCGHEGSRRETGATCKHVNKEAKESTSLGAVTKLRLVKTQQTEKIQCLP